MLGRGDLKVKLSLDLNGFEKSMKRVSPLPYSIFVEVP